MQLQDLVADTGRREDKPRPRQTREDALAAVQARHGKTRSQRQAEANGTGDAERQELTGAAAGIAAARRRGYGR